MLTVLTQCALKWKSFQTFGSNSVLLLKFEDECKPFMVISALIEYSKTLGKAVHSWRIGASRF
jgi:hypothetical protein